MFRLTTNTIIHRVKPANVRLLTRGYADKKDIPAADEGSGEFNGPLYSNKQPLTATPGGSNTHVTRKDYVLDFHTSASRRGMKEREAAANSDASRTEQSGGGTEKVNWDKQFPGKPNGPIIGMQDERGGINQNEK